MIDVYHNILWSRYKAAVFSELFDLCSKENININFYQIAETELCRINLSKVDFHLHKYPYDLLFKGAYEKVKKLNLYIKLISLLLKSNAKLVVLPGYSNIEHWVMLLILLIKRRKIGVFCDSTIFDNKQTQLKFILKRFFFRRCDVVFAYGERSFKYVEGFGVKNEKIYYPCQAAEVFSPTIPIEQILEKKNKIKNKYYLYVGRISPEKGLDTLINAWKKLNELNIQLKLKIIGDGTCIKQLNLLIDKLGLQDCVELLGSKTRDQLPEYYIGSRGLILPSKKEPWGLVANESLFFGSPIIVSSACGCIPELVKDSTGVSFNSGDVDHLVNCIIDVENKLNCNLITVESCRKTISIFTPSNAAKRIFMGLINCLKIRGF